MMAQGNKTTATSAWILVVHGRAAHARPVERLLEGAGFEVVSAGEPEEVRALIEYGHPDLAVVAGGEAAALAGQLMREVGRPVIAVAAAGGAAEASDGPFRCTLDALLATVFEHLESQESD